MCHISREKSGTTPGGMNTISFQQVRSAPKTRPIVYKTYVVLRAPLRHPAIEWRQSAMNLITPVSREGDGAYYSVWHRTCKFTHLFNIIFSDLRLAKLNIISAGVDNNLTEFTFSISQALWLPVNNGLWWLVSLFSRLYNRIAIVCKLVTLLSQQLTIPL